MPYADAFDRNEPLGKPMLGSLVLHASVVGFLVAGSFIHRDAPQQWGAKESIGGSTVVNPVARIPMMTRSGEVNPVANDTESQAPQAPPKPKPVLKEKAPEPDAIPLRSRATPKRPSPETASTQ